MSNIAASLSPAGPIIKVIKDLNTVMFSMIVDVSCDDGSIQIARVVHEHAGMFAINFLELKKVGIYDFSSNTELISKESVSGFYDVDNLEATDLYVKVNNGYELIDDSEDEDYIGSEEEGDDESEDESLVDEDENEEA
jgi:hypothetical protein